MGAKIIFHAEDEQVSFFGAPQIWDNTIKFMGGNECDYVFVDKTTDNIHSNNTNVRINMITLAGQFVERL